MTALNKQALRQKAVKAGGEEWQSRKEPGIGGEYTVIVKGSLVKHQGWSTHRPVADEIVDKKIMDFIAAANPATVLALLDELDAAENNLIDSECHVAELEESLRDKQALLESAEKRIADHQLERLMMVDAMHAAVALNNAGINLNDFEKCISRLHEWGALPDYCIALYVDFIHGIASENKLLDFGYINDNGKFGAQQAEKRTAELRDWNFGLAQESFTYQQKVAELEARTVNLPKRSVGEVMHMSGFSRDYAEGWCASNDNAIHEIRAAGIGVKGDE